MLSSLRARIPFKPRNALTIGLHLVVAGLPLSLAPAVMAQQQLQRYDIAAGALGDVLSQFARQAGVAISFDAAQVAGKRSAGLQGSYGVQEGFAALLHGQGLQAQWSADGYVLVAVAGSPGALELGATTINSQALGSTTEGTGSYTTGTTSSATKLNLSLRETPQSVTVVTRQRMDDQNMKTLDDVLQGATGITIMKNGGERSMYSARGQLIDTLQIDGIPTNISNAYSMDAISKPTTDIYDRVEIVRGATGLMEGAGNPSASINLVRKRPTREAQALAEVSAGSWDDYKGMLDVSSPLNGEGTLRNRTVLSYNNANSYLDTAQKENQLFYSVFEADLSADTLVTLGFTYQKERNSGYDWSGLPTRPNGEFYPISRSTSLTGKWNHLDKRNTTLFGDVQRQLGNDWKLVVAASQTWAKSDFLGNFTTRVDGSEDRFSLQPRHFRYNDTQTSVDTYLTGPFQLLGRQHELVLGSNVRKDDFDYHGGNDVGYSYLFDMNDLDAFNPPRPTGLAVNKWKYNKTQEQEGIYAAGRFSLTDSTRLILGSRVSWFKTQSLTHVTRKIEGEYSANREVTPYAGLIQDLDENWSAYASYTEIFKPQDNLGTDGRILKPMTGSNYEIGLKGEFLEKRVTTAIALFQADQTGRPEALSDSEAETLCPALPNGCYASSDKVRNRGIDLELAGELLPGWNLSAGYTYTQSKYIAGAQKGEDFSASAPRHLLKIATDYRLPGNFNHVRVGGSFHAQSKMTYTDAEVSDTFKIEQKPYTLTNLHAVYEISPNMELQYNLDNVFDKKYIQTTGNDNYWNFYGEPRNFNLTLRTRF
ncbi:TonB-dependent siderophore receptor [Pseudomonas carassii]|uniref:TonB-dependent siderophore receptor n=1 Tax=Pseudomonas carassii TaxID=3115855 RepID=A0ABU7HA77_9PSED|nr:TonB-dependent siderophore receptor [Pseudomonas sp. 137P]MEE1888195.1 TonB-dependent siderophore receptor [Pseudomonas sp. 137P]